MGTKGTWTAFGVILAACVLLSTAGCPRRVKSTAQAIQALATSPPLTSVEHTDYDIGPTEWGPFYFSAGRFEGRPVAAFRSPGGFSVAVADTPLPESAGDWQIILLDSRPRSRMISLAASEAGVFVSYLAGPREDSHLMLASCAGADPSDPLAWSLEELPPELGNVSIRAIAAGGDRLSLACRDRDTRLPMYIWRELATDDAGWQIQPAGDDLSGSLQLTLIEIDGAQALGYASADRTSFGLLRDLDKPAPDGWQATVIDSGTERVILAGHADFAAHGRAAAAVFHHGEPPQLRFAVSADAAAASPDWQLSGIVKWEMLGDVDLLFSDDLPVVLYTADMSALWAFFATTPTPADNRDWRMCQLSEDLGTHGYNGVEAVILEGHLLALYIKLDAMKNVTLSATLIEIPER